MTQPLPLPNAIGWWLREGAEHPVYVSGKSMYWHSTSNNPMAIPSGRWLPVAMPTFPAREKAPMRLGVLPSGEWIVWMPRVGKNSWWVSSGGHWLHGNLEDVKFLTPEFIDELPTE